MQPNLFSLLPLIPCVSALKRCHGKYLLLASLQLSPFYAVKRNGSIMSFGEVVTGLLRRPDGEIATSRKFPIGILPLGRTNTVGNALFARDTNTVRTMADSAMAIIREFAKPIDVVKIEVLETETDLPGKPVYCLAGIEWGAYRDTNARKDKYWYFDGLRWYAAYLFNGLKSDISWRCEADLDFSLPCAGCSNCHSNAAIKQDVLSDKQKVGARWWQSYLPRLGQSPGDKVVPSGNTLEAIQGAAERKSDTSFMSNSASGKLTKNKFRWWWGRGRRVEATNKYHVEQIDYSRIHNKACGIRHRKEVSTIEFSLTTANVCKNCVREGDSHLQLNLGPKEISYTDFVAEGWKRIRGQEPFVEEKLKTREFELRPALPNNSKEQEKWISIDNEDYELKPIHVTLLPKKIHVFYKPENMI
ncbi:unnamed protein product [Timema podura]|uniref:Acylglycerol kinase, mitochondrial n=1 Tax=Timema podura TaxID=61482 RepID=A0ABN7NHF0_TIMPD|nr:unnamed protein product [Timema podura]